MSRSFVIDTNILTYAAGGHGDEKLTSKCTAIVFNFITDDDLVFALDTEGHIIEEYMDNIQEYRHPHTKLIQEYFEKQLRSKEGISYFIPIDESKVEELKNRGFHQDDLMFVRVAPKTNTESIASCDGESITEEEYKEWVEEELNLSVYSPDGLKEEL